MYTWLLLNHTSISGCACKYDPTNARSPDDSVRGIVESGHVTANRVLREIDGVPESVQNHHGQGSENQPQQQVQVLGKGKERNCKQSRFISNAYSVSNKRAENQPQIPRNPQKFLMKNQKIIIIKNYRINDFFTYICFKLYVASVYFEPF